MTTKLLSLPFPDVLERLDPVVIENPPVLRLRAFEAVDRVRCFDGAGAPLERTTESGMRVFRAHAPLAPGCKRHNCTYPAADGRRYHWLSQFWYVP